MTTCHRAQKSVAFAVALAVAFILAMAPLTARAEEAAGTTGGDTTADTTGTTGNPSNDAGEAKTGTVTLEFLDTNGNKITTKDGGKIALYRVAALDSSNGTARFDFNQGNFSKSSIVTEISSITEQDLMNQSERISANLADEVAKNGTRPSMTSAISSSQAQFASVPEGLYLVCQSAKVSGDLGMVPFLITVPDEEGSYNVVAWPKPVTDKPDDKGEPNSSSSSSTNSSSSSQPSSSSSNSSGNTNNSGGGGNLNGANNNVIGDGNTSHIAATADVSPLWATPALLCGLAGIGVGVYLNRQRSES